MKSNLRVPEEVQGAGYAANRTARNAASSRWMTILARLGYGAKGVVYLIIGWLAVQVAIGAGGKTTDQRGALQVIAATAIWKISTCSCYYWLDWFRDLVLSPGLVRYRRQRKQY